MIVLAANERTLLEKLADAGKPTALEDEDLVLGNF